MRKKRNEIAECCFFFLKISLNQLKQLCVSSCDGVELKLLDLNLSPELIARPLDDCNDSFGGNLM